MAEVNFESTTAALLLLTADRVEPHKNKRNTHSRRDGAFVSATRSDCLSQFQKEKTVLVFDLILALFQSMDDVRIMLDAMCPFAGMTERFHKCSVRSCN